MVFGASRLQGLQMLCRYIVLEMAPTSVLHCQGARGLVNDLEHRSRSLEAGD